MSVVIAFALPAGSRDAPGGAVVVDRGQLLGAVDRHQRVDGDHVGALAAELERYLRDQRPDE